jgi:subtilisin family serine protease
VLGDSRFFAPAYRSRTLRLGVLVGLVALGLTAGPTMAKPDGSGGDVVQGSYIVTLERGNDPAQDAPGLAREHGGRAGHIYKHALQGFSFEGSQEAAERLARHPKVRTVVPDQRVEASAQSIPTGVRRIGGPSSSTAAGDGAGAVNADIAILDTGIDAAHPDLNVVGGVNCSSGSSYADGNGHGTHVAGTAAAIDNSDGVVGVAPGARLWAVRVLDNSGSGSWASVICGIDWVTSNAATIEVANMSLGGSGSESHCADGGLREAICASVGAGVPYAVAAGNSGVNATSYVPATFPEVMTVSALADFNGAPGGGASATCRADQDDTLADFSNYGSDVDLMAPGVCIESTWMGGGYNTISGTSMATPHVAGATALYRSDHGRVSPEAVKTALQSLGTLDWTGDRDTTKERLLNVGSGTVTPPPPPPPGGIQLAAQGYRIKGRQQVDLTWSGTTTTSPVAVYRNGSLLRNTANDGSETDAIGIKGAGSWTYQICETDSTPTCSNTAAVTF